MSIRTYRTCSVVMAVYKNDQPTWLTAAIESILNQTVKSDDIIIVRDGPVSAELEDTLKKYEQLPELTVIRLETNIGAGQARNTSISQAKNELVATMDADDISLPNRFELQINAFNNDKNLTLAGGQLAEFESNNPENVVAYRKVPLTNEEITKFARRRMPVNNPTIMFKKQAVLACGGYGNVRRCQDYHLIAHLIAAQHKLINLPDTLLLYRLDDQAIKRAKSLRHIKSAIATQRKIRALGVCSTIDVAIVAISKILIFLMPKSLAKTTYRVLVRKKATV